MIYSPCLVFLKRGFNPQRSVHRESQSERGNHARQRAYSDPPAEESAADDRASHIDNGHAVYPPHQIVKTAHFFER